MGNDITHGIHVLLGERHEIELGWFIPFPLKYKQGFGAGKGRNCCGISPSVETAEGGAGDNGEPFLANSLETEEGFWG